MKNVNALLTILTVSACLGCSGVAERPVTGTAAAVDFPSHQALLLVSLADGSVIKQTIESDADVCFKLNAASTTTCLTQGAPVVDPATNAVIGYEMIENKIDLIAKTD